MPKAYQRHYEFLNQFKSAERIAERYGITRDRAEAFGLTSQQLALHITEAVARRSSAEAPEGTPEPRPVD